MLYDPKWEKTTEVDPFSLKALIAWLETQNPEQEYPYMDCHGECLIGQYGRAVGVDWRKCHSAFYDRDELHPIAGGWPWTFGAALERARNLD